ncbi:Regulator of chromosome condensation [Macleaya cordata]|uniref:Regulator of chromosome condensation n=1 Tax=Macleaya cordata TaxID=56857 RepID=A0A200PS81_MACCD|nr:Regulator of chromosome condensation [Macleaya cordata]
MAHHPRYTFLARYISSFSPSSKVPLLWKTEADSATSISTLQLLSWGRGGSGQLGGGIEEIRLYPTPVASFLLPSNFRLSPTSGLLPQPSALQLLSWGRGGSGQLGGSIEEIR